METAGADIPLESYGAETVEIGEMQYAGTGVGECPPSPGIPGTHRLVGRPVLFGETGSLIYPVSFKQLQRASQCIHRQVSFAVPPVRQDIHRMSSRSQLRDGPAGDPASVGKTVEVEQGQRSAAYEATRYSRPLKAV